ncbi:Gfo/Idh/MocA family protein [Aggregatilinea lenta]|uniref:Gfo/Idh/MocA family protein n=1 Tax=Aggregatilinea lenta TaxID=913108 RepID=UPI000E5A3AC6|nr:Gfo/Idh/MocA family oxidoreductase [Aggregatilinea lenta]
MPDVAVIGTGYIGAVHLDTLLRIPGVRVKALVDANLEPAQALAQRYGIPTVAADYRDLLDDPTIEVVHNCTPNALHYPITREFIEAGKHVLSEKPLAMTAEEARALDALAAAHNRVTAVNFCYRYYPTVQEAAARVRAAEIGRVHSVFGAYFQDWLLYPTDYSWRLDRAQSGASNTMADIGSHWLDLAQFVVGAKIVEVMADLRTILPLRKKSRGPTLTFAQADADTEWTDVPVEVDDYGAVLVRFDNGAAGSFMACQLCAGRKCSIDLQVYGSKAALAWNHERSAELWIGQRDRANQTLIEGPQLQDASTAGYARLPSGHPMGYFDAVYNLFSDFYKAVEHHRRGETFSAPLPTFGDGAYEMALLDAILKSHATRSWCAVSTDAVQRG